MIPVAQTAAASRRKSRIPMSKPGRLMTEENSPPAAGHNNPPGPSLTLSPEEWTEWMRHVFEGVAERRADLLASFKRFDEGFPLTRGAQVPVGIEAWSDDVQGRAGDLKDKIAAVLRQAENLHGIEKAPILAAARAIDGFKRLFAAELEMAVVIINERRTLYARHVEARSRAAAEQEAREAREAAQKAAAEASRTLAASALQQAADAEAHAEAAQALAEAPAAEHSRVHGPLGSVSSLRTNWRFIEEESDLMTLAQAAVSGKVPLTYLSFNVTRINLAVRTEKIRSIPGCVIRDEQVVR